MNYENILVEHKEKTITLTINREKALNSLNKKVFKELFQFFKIDLPTRTNVAGIIITGAGKKAFVAGADIKEFFSLENAQQGAELSRKGHQTFNAIENCPIPVIAAVNGFALGGGCELAMACHLRIAATNAKFGLPETGLAILPGYGGTQRMIQYIGKTKAMELMMTNEMIDAHKAEQLGLVNSVVDIDELIDTTEKMLQKIYKKGPKAIESVIRSVNAYFDGSQDGFRTEINEFGKLSETNDFKEGATAFVEKRKPNYKGN